MVKDLTHYFVSPPKSSEKIEVKEGKNRNDRLVTNNLNVNNNDKGKNEKEEEVEFLDKIVEIKDRKKRSRVKIKISLKETKKNSRCDIVENVNDVVDKTPSPFNKKIINKNSTTKRRSNNENDHFKSVVNIMSENDATFCNTNNKTGEETPNAFQVLMTRNKPSTNAVAELQNDQSLNLSNQHSQIRLGINNNKNERRMKKEKLTATEKKGYSKRKISEIEEIQVLSDGRTEKRAKLLKGELKEFKYDGRDTKRDVRNKRKEVRAKKKNSKDRKIDCNKNDDNVGVSKSNGNGAASIKNLNKSNEDDNSDNSISLIEVLKTEDSGKKETPKNRQKWTIRVKLQSHSDDDDGNETKSDSDYIFTPTNKVRYRKKRIRKSSSDEETKEEKKPEEFRIEKPAAQKSIKSLFSEPPDSKSSTKRTKHRAKRSLNKINNSETNRIEESKNSTSNITERVIDSSIEILETDISELDNSPRILQEKKLAPLFVRPLKPNSATLEARRSFLKSGIPEAVKKMILSDQKLFPSDIGTLTMPFPTIGHVLQLENEIPNVYSETESNRRSSKGFYKQKNNVNQSIVSPSLNPSDFKSISNFRAETTREIRKDKRKKFSQIKRENFETVLKEVESRCSDARNMWEGIVSARSNSVQKKSSPKKKNKKLNLQRRRKSNSLESVEPNPDCLNPTWTSKYKPTSSVQVVGNESAVTKLRNWLSGWRLPSPKDDHSSGDEFYSSDYSSSSSYENNQVAVLLGPHGSGKTASVYALAKELGYRVLEVNASSRRTGKKLMSDFQEATKSHRVKRDQRTLLPARKKSSENKVPQNSLILIEDVDLIFEEDEGFVSATYQLAANTRRPIVMTCKETCAHLHRMAPQQQLIRFQTVTGNRVSALLELIALAESSYRLPRPCVDILLRNGDLRQSLLQLQYILSSGPPSVSQLDISPSSTLWLDMQPQIYKPVIKSSKKIKKELSMETKLIAEEEQKLVVMLAKNLDNISLISSLTEVENPASPPWSTKLNPSLSLLEDFKLYSNSADLGSEIAEWLRIASFKSDPMISNWETNFESRSQLAIKRKVKLGIDSALAQAVPSTVEHRSKSTDYLPIIRTICRSEEDRASINTKRGKRFYNYLHGLNLSSASSNILSAAGSVFKDKSLSTT